MDNTLTPNDPPASKQGSSSDSQHPESTGNQQNLQSVESPINNPQIGYLEVSSDRAWKVRTALLQSPDGIAKQKQHIFVIWGSTLQNLSIYSLSSQPTNRWKSQDILCDSPQRSTNKSARNRQKKSSSPPQQIPEPQQQPTSRGKAALQIVQDYCALYPTQENLYDVACLLKPHLLRILAGRPTPKIVCPPPTAPSKQLPTQHHQDSTQPSQTPHPATSETFEQRVANITNSIAQQENQMRHLLKDLGLGEWFPAGVFLNTEILAQDHLFQSTELTQILNLWTRLARHKPSSKEHQQATQYAKNKLKRILVAYYTQHGNDLLNAISEGNLQHIGAVLKKLHMEWLPAEFLTKSSQDIPREQITAWYGNHTKYVQLLSLQMLLHYWTNNHSSCQQARSTLQHFVAITKKNLRVGNTSDEINQILNQFLAITNHTTTLNKALQTTLQEQKLDVKWLPNIIWLLPSFVVPDESHVAKTLKIMQHLADSPNKKQELINLEQALKTVSPSNNFLDRILEAVAKLNTALKQKHSKDMHDAAQQQIQSRQHALAHHRAIPSRYPLPLTIYPYSASLPLIAAQWASQRQPNDAVLLQCINWGDHLMNFALAVSQEDTTYLFPITLCVRDLRSFALPVIRSKQFLHKICIQADTQTKHHATRSSSKATKSAAKSDEYTQLRQQERRMLEAQAANLSERAFSILLAHKINDMLSDMQASAITPDNASKIVDLLHSKMHQLISELQSPQSSAAKTQLREIYHRLANVDGDPIKTSTIEKAALGESSDEEEIEDDSEKVLPETLSLSLDEIRNLQQNARELQFSAYMLSLQAQPENALAQYNESYSRLFLAYSQLQQRIARQQTYRNRYHGYYTHESSDQLLLRQLGIMLIINAIEMRDILKTHSDLQYTEDEAKLFHVAAEQLLNRHDQRPPPSESLEQTTPAHSVFNYLKARFFLDKMPAEPHHTVSQQTIAPSVKPKKKASSLGRHTLFQPEKTSENTEYLSTLTEKEAFKPLSSCRAVLANFNARSDDWKCLPMAGEQADVALLNADILENIAILHTEKRRERMLNLADQARATSRADQAAQQPTADNFAAHGIFTIRDGKVFAPEPALIEDEGEEEEETDIIEEKETSLYFTRDLSANTMTVYRKTKAIKEDGHCAIRILEEDKIQTDEDIPSLREKADEKLIAYYQQNKAARVRFSATIRNDARIDNANTSMHQEDEQKRSNGEVLYQTNDLYLEALLGRNNPRAINMDNPKLSTLLRRAKEYDEATKQYGDLRRELRNKHGLGEAMKQDITSDYCDQFLTWLQLNQHQEDFKKLQQLQLQSIQKYQEFELESQDPSIIEHFIRQNPNRMLSCTEVIDLSTIRHYSTTILQNKNTKTGHELIVSQHHAPENGSPQKTIIAYFNPARQHFDKAVVVRQPKQKDFADNRPPSALPPNPAPNLKKSKTPPLRPLLPQQQYESQLGELFPRLPEVLLLLLNGQVILNEKNERYESDLIINPQDQCVQQFSIWNSDDKTTVEFKEEYPQQTMSLFFHFTWQDKKPNIMFECWRIDDNNETEKIEYRFEELKLSDALPDCNTLLSPHIQSSKNTYGSCNVSSSDSEEGETEDNHTSTPNVRYWR